MGPNFAALTKLLRKRAVEYNIPSWPGETPFDRVLVYRIPDDASERETFVAGGKIVKAESAQDASKARSPHGIIVSAGLGALGILYDHGMGLGDIVWIMPHAPYRFEVEKNAQGKSIEFFPMYVGDVVLSEDVSQRLADGELDIVRVGNQFIYSRKSEKGEAKSKKRTDPAQNADSI
jgi:hypothetical protein